MTGNLYFRDSRGNKRFMCECEYDDAWTHIKEFLDDHNYECYYVRKWEKDGEIWHDVGSHSEFFIFDLK